MNTKSRNSLIPVFYVFLSGFLFSSSAMADKSLEERIERLEKGAEVKAPSHGGWFKFRGRLHIDAAGFIPEDGMKLGNAAFNNGTQLRRARLGLEGGYYDDWRWRLEADFGGATSFQLQDAYLQYRGFKDTIVTVGQQLAPTSMATLSGSAQTLTFMERASVVNAFDRFRTIGASVWYSPSKHWYLQAAYHSAPAEIQGTEDESNNFHGRLGFAPINEQNKVVHLAIAGSHHRDFSAAESNQFRFRDRPEIRVDNYRVVDTGNIANADSADQFIIDGFASYNNMHVQGEYWNRNVSRTAGNSDVSFDGFYIQGAYILTGEHKPYTSYGRYGRIKPNNNFSLKNGGKGAWEIAFRYSELDLDDGPINGGQMNNTTVGLNWYWNQQASLQFNWIKYDAKNTPQELNGNDLSGHAFGTRISLDW